MSVSLIIPPRPRDLGEGMVVRRALPFAKKRMVGPFIFWDHMGPVAISEKFSMTVRSHPHIGLSTLTYLLSGEILHRDSLGNELMIRPGEVNWMTAGNGIVHSERAHYSHHPAEKLEGIQLWIALPEESEEIAPSFEHFKEKDLPLIKLGHINWRLIAGSYENTRSPVPTFSPLFYLATKARTGESAEITIASDQEGAVYIAHGEVEIENQLQGEGHLVVFAPGTPVKFTVTKDATLFVFGGTPFAEGRQIWWNFVASTQDLIAAAKVRWTEQTMGKVPHEVDWIPLPPQ